MKGSCPSVLLPQTLHHHSPQIYYKQSCRSSLLFIFTPKPFHDRSHQDSALLSLSLLIPLLNIQLFLSFSLLYSPFLFPLQVLWFPARYFVFMHSILSTLLSSDGESVISQGSAMGLPIPSADKASPNFPKRNRISPFEGTLGQKPLCWRVFLRFATSGCSGGRQKKWKPREPRKPEQLQRLLLNKETVAWHTQRAHQRQSWKAERHWGWKKREAGYLKERVRADEVRDDGSRGNVEMESTGWRGGKKAERAQEGKRIIFPLAAPGLGIINSSTYCPHAPASDKMNKTLGVFLFQTHRNRREN